MLKKFINFIKYNNIAALVLVALLILGTSALAAEPVRQALGQKITQTKGIDNTLLLSADLDKMNMDFRIEKIEQDDKFYYVTYTYLDLVKTKRAWEYQVREKVMKVSRKIKKDLGNYLAQELSEVKYQRLKYLKQAQAKAREQGKQKRVEVVAYSGLLGKVLNTAQKVFPGYKAVKVKPLPSPPDLSQLRALPARHQIANKTIATSSPDNLTQVYLDYIKRKDPDSDNVFGILDNCPQVYNPDQLDSDGDGVGDACDTDNNSQLSTTTPSTSTSTDITTSTSSLDQATSSPPDSSNSSESNSQDQATSSQEVIISSPATTTESEVEIINLEQDNTDSTTTATSS